MKKIVCFLLLLSISGCAAAANMRARDDMESSKSAYKNCLASNPSDPDKCEGFKRAYEADMKAYKSTRLGKRISIDTE